MTGMNPSRVCVKCGGELQEGFVLDNTYGARLQSEWIEGAPERSRWVGIKLKGDLAPLSLTLEFYSARRSKAMGER